MYKKGGRKYKKSIRIEAADRGETLHPVQLSFPGVLFQVRTCYHEILEEPINFKDAQARVP
jgi:hypothetical protein